MARLTRRAVLQSGAAVTAGAAAPAMAAPAAGPTPAANEPLTSPRERLLLDFGWRFHLGHAQDPARDFGFGLDQRTFAKSGTGVTSAAQADFDDGQWVPVNLPHDWAVELPFVPSAGRDPKAEEDPRAAHGFRPLGREYPETSIGWYRRRFDLPAADLGRKLTLRFDGVFRDCLAILNGHIVAGNASGYVPFEADISDVANYGGANVLVVRVDATLGEGWFYEGAGIYRHVWLIKSDMLHIVPDGVAVRTSVKGDAALLTVTAEIQNDGSARRAGRLTTQIRDSAGAAVAMLDFGPLAIDAGERRSVTQSATLRRPALWSLESPNLYRAETLLADGAAIDAVSTTFGIRTIRFDAEHGFFLNGKAVKLKGTCNHQDHAGVGAALPDRLHAFRIEKLKEMGSNAYRAAHNPPAPELLDACDRLGMLVIDETRRMASDAEGLSQLTRMIRRDRNHPSIILWSIGNEEQAQQGTDTGARIARRMKRVCTALDPTRPITAAMDHEWGKGISPVLDVVGFNYRTDQIDDFHKRFPGQPVIGTETASTVSTRGIYARDEVRGFVPAYDTDFPWWASTASAWWNIVATRPFIAGGFVWTGFDYRGEPTPFNRWPNVGSQFGIMDTCGFPKDNYYYYQAWWGTAPVVHLLPHWNWPGREGQTIKVWCHSNLDRVELLLNGRSLGVRGVVPNNHVEWDVTYAPGVLEARGFRGSAMVLSDRRETTGAAAAIRLSADRAAIAADGEDVCVVTVDVVDAQGRIVPDADADIAFALSGPGAVIGVGNGDPTSHEPDKASRRRAFNGRCAAIIQSAATEGTLRLTARSPGLADGTLAIGTMRIARRPFVA